MSLLAGCGKADTSGGSAASGELTLWTHNAGNKEELAVVNQIVADYNASQTKNKVKVQAFPQASYNDAVVAAATAKKLPCILDTDAPTVPSWAFAGYLAELNLPQDLVGKQLASTLGKYNDKLYSIGYYDAALAIFARKSALDCRRRPDPDDRPAVDGGRVRPDAWRRSRRRVSTRSRSTWAPVIPERSGGRTRTRRSCRASAAT